MRLSATAGSAVVGVAAFGIAAPFLRRIPLPRRFTGSYVAGGEGANDFPVTAFFADDPAPVDIAAWRLRIGGRVERPLTLTIEDLTSHRRTGTAAFATDTETTRSTMQTVVAASAVLDRAEPHTFESPSGLEKATRAIAERTGDQIRHPVIEVEPANAFRAVIDCTGGWCADRVWSGVPLATLLDAAGAPAGATAVEVHSLTGYFTVLPLREARAALLATHVGGQPLDHGHGFPLRLVAPCRRGFQWVKWVDEVRVL